MAHSDTHAYHKPGGRLPLLSAMPAVTFPAVGLASTKLYCLVTEAHRCEKLAQSFYAVVPGQDSNPRPFDRESDTLPQHHDATSVVFQWICMYCVPVAAPAAVHATCQVGVPAMCSHLHIWIYQWIWMFIVAAVHTACSASVPVSTSSTSLRPQPASSLFSTQIFQSAIYEMYYSRFTAR